MRLKIMKTTVLVTLQQKLNNIKSLLTFKTIEDKV